MAVLTGALNLHDLVSDYESASNHEVCVKGGLVSVIDFGQWSTVFTVTATQPEQLEDFAEILLRAAMHLRMARVGNSETKSLASMYAIEADALALRVEDAEQQDALSSLDWRETA